MDKETFRYHEVGHAVIAIAAGLPFLCLLQNADFGALLLEPVRPEQLEDRQFRNAYAIACVGGSMAESVLNGGGGLHSLVGGLGMTDLKNLTSIGMTLNEILSACYQSERYLKTHWPAVRRVASALKDCPMLLEVDVRSAAGDLPPLFEPEPEPEPKSKPAATRSTQSFKSSTKSLWMRQCLPEQSFKC